MPIPPIHWLRLRQSSKAGESSSGVTVAIEPTTTASHRAPNFGEFTFQRLSKKSLSGVSNTAQAQISLAQRSEMGPFCPVSWLL
jgi:hypothetical protein